MRRHICILFFVICIVSFPIAIFLGGCGGSSGGGDGSSGVSDSSSGTGTVSVLLTDGPADDYENIWIWVTEVSLIPPEGDGDRAPVVIFQSSEGYKVDLLDYRDKDFLLTVNGDVAVGVYEKVRLGVSKIESKAKEEFQGVSCDGKWKLPSGKIDLNPRGSFKVEPGETLSIRLDIDANKSINLHTAGQSGKCIFRPVVFVDIEPGMPVQRCPQIVTGTIEEIIYGDKGETVEGFILNLGDGRGELKVRLLDDVVLFDDYGEPADDRNVLVDAKEDEKSVTVRGRLDAKGRLMASLVVIGEFSVVDGIVQDTLYEGKFPFLPDPGEPIEGDVDVRVFGETLLLVGCDEEVDEDAVQGGRPARVYGKLIEGDVEFRAFAVFLKRWECSGQLVSVAPTAGGNTLTIVGEADGEVFVFLPEETPIYLEGDGEVPLDLLSDLLECDEQQRQFRVVLDPNADETAPLTAIEATLQADRLEGMVYALGGDRTRTFFIDGQRVYVQPGATILDLRGKADVVRDFGKIKTGDRLVCFGLKACPADEVDFFAFVVLITSPGD